MLTPAGQPYTPDLHHTGDEHTAGDDGEQHTAGEEGDDIHGVRWIWSHECRAAWSMESGTHLMFAFGTTKSYEVQPSLLPETVSLYLHRNDLVAA